MKLTKIINDNFKFVKITTSIQNEDFIGILLAIQNTEANLPNWVRFIVDKDRFKIRNYYKLTLEDLEIIRMLVLHGVKIRPIQFISLEDNVKLEEIDFDKFDDKIFNDIFVNTFIVDQHYHDLTKLFVNEELPKFLQISFVKKIFGQPTAITRRIIELLWDNRQSLSRQNIEVIKHNVNRVYLESVICASLISKTKINPIEIKSSFPIGENTHNPNSLGKPLMMKGAIDLMNELNYPENFKTKMIKMSFDRKSI